MDGRAVTSESSVNNLTSSEKVMTTEDETSSDMTPSLICKFIKIIIHVSYTIHSRPGRDMWPHWKNAPVDRPH